jgi:FAD/FMN-containing dehydrogenase
MSVGLMSDLATLVRGEVIYPGDPAYDDARSVYNAAIDRHPAVIVRCRGVADVVEAVRFARANGLPVAVRGGGHSVAGHGTCDDGLLVDLSRMRGVHVDAGRQRVRVEGGATLGDLDRETQVFGLAVPTGQVSETGIAGLALNGGMGMLQRRFGLTCDNLLSAQVVTAAGEVVTASPTSHPELFWALRGGGGNFGVVTSFEFQAHRVGPIILAGLVAYPVERAAEILAALADFIADAPEELSADALFMHAPPLPVVPPEHHGRLVIGVFLRYSGDPETGMAVVEPLRRLASAQSGGALFDFAVPMPYAVVQSMLDPLNPRGNQHYWSGEYLDALGPEQLAALSRIGAELPGGHCLVEVIPFNAAVTRVSADATAFAHRQEGWLVHLLGQWHEPDQARSCTDWVKRSGAALRAMGTGDSYLNLVTDDEDVDRVSAFWNEDRLRRLGAVKAVYDPENTFRFNHNISPLAGTGEVDR